MNIENYELKVNDKTTLKGYIYHPQDSKGVVVICHGMAEHIERYDDFATFLSNNGYTVIGYNQRGHGSTAGNVDNLGYMDDKDNMKALIGDLRKTIMMAREKFVGQKVFLFGHSMGSFVSQRFIELNSKLIDGVILCGSSLNKGLLFHAAYCLSSMITFFKGRRHKSNLLNKLSFGSYNKQFEPKRTEFDWLSENRENVDKYIADEYCGTVFSASFFKDLTHMFIETSKHYGDVRKTLPIYIIGGSLDPVSNSAKGLYALAKEYDKNGIRDVNLKVYEGMRHEILNEVSNQYVYNDVLYWLEKH